MSSPQQLMGALAFALGAVVFGTVAAAGQETTGALTAEIEFGGTVEPVLQWGDRERLYYRTDRDAHIAVLHIDTDGDTRLVYPRSPLDVNYVRGGQEHRLLFPRTSTFRVEEDPGVGYFFLIASTEPLLLTRLDYSNEVQDWDLRPVGRRVFTDPYEAIDRWVEFLIPDWEYVPYAVGTATYHVEERHDYPRFMCYGCHTDGANAAPAYAEWNPYVAACESFQVVSYADPIYYPVTRYPGTNVVFVNPVFVGPRFGFERRSRDAEPTPYIATRTTRPAAEGRVQPVRRPADVALGSETTPRRTVPVIRATGSAGAGAARPELRRRSRTTERPAVDLGVITGPARRPAATPPPTVRRETAVHGAGSTGRAGERVRVQPTRSGVRVTPNSAAGNRAVYRGNSTRPTVARPSGVVRGSTGSARSGAVRRLLPSSGATGASRAPSARTPRATVRTPSRSGIAAPVRRPSSSKRPVMIRRPTRSGGAVRPSRPSRGSSGGAVRRKGGGDGHGK